MNDNITRNDMKYLYTCILNEATSRSELPDEIFGVPEERKYPLDTKEHVYSAVKLFNHVNKKYEEELADNINKKIKEYNITDINPGSTNRFSKYYNQPVKEGFVNQLKMPFKINPRQKEEETLKKHSYPGYLNLIKSTHNEEDLQYLRSDLNISVHTYTIIGERIEKIKKLGRCKETENYYTAIYNKYVSKGITKRDCDLLIKWYKEVCAKQITKQLKELRSGVKESTNIILEAPTDVDVDEDDVNDYSDDVEDDTSDEDESDTGDDTDEEDLDDEPNDYSDDIDSEDDASDTEDDSDTSDDDVDAQSDEDGEPVDDTDSNDSGEDDTTDDSGDESETDDSDDTGFDDEPNDYSDSVDGDGSGDDSDTTDDDTSTDGSDDSTDSSDDSMESDDENNTLNNNNIIKNYNLLMDFQKLHTSLEDILTNLKAASYKTSLQNAILRRVLSNVETLKDEVLSYIEYNFGSNYTQNLYYFNTYIQLLKITLEMMKKMGELSQDDK